MKRYAIPAILGSLALAGVLILVAATPSRSPQWRKVRATHLQQEAWCRVCGSQDKLEVHHLTPFAVNPTLELAATNLVTLCRGRFGGGCHWYVGHVGESWKTNNVEIEVVFGGVSNSTGYRVMRMREGG